jgi:hypothetical protein
MKKIDNWSGKILLSFFRLPAHVTVGKTSPHRDEIAPAFFARIIL